MNARLDLLASASSAAAPLPAVFRGCCTPYVAGVDAAPSLVEALAATLTLGARLVSRSLRYSLPRAAYARQ